jgi:hypothetical protein
MSRRTRGAVGATALTSILLAPVTVGCSRDNPGSQDAASQSSPGGVAGSKVTANQAANRGGGSGSAGSAAGGTTTSSDGSDVGGQQGGATTGLPSATGGIGNAGGSKPSGGGTDSVGGNRASGGAGASGAATAGRASGLGGLGSAGGSKTGGGTGGAIVRGGAAGTTASAAGSATRGGATATGGIANTAGTSGSSGDLIANFQNGVFWNDTSGKRIEAHGGGFILVNRTWYWIGEDKSANSGNFKAVNCYSSTDLEHWKFENDIITRNTATDLAASDRIIERPKVVYNDSTKQYVMWLHWEGANYADAKAGVFSSSTICGDYKYESSFRPNNNMSRDDTLFKDDDGKAYFMSAANENADMMLYELSADYLRVGRQVGTLWAGAKREAPAVFKKDSTYFFITSACTGWDPNQAAYATATSMGTNWTSLSNLGDSTTYDTQSTYVIPVVGSKTTTYIYAGDRWQDPDLVGSKYIWLPLKINGTKLTLDYYDKWQLNVTTGEWSTNVKDGYVPQTGWKLISADSQETQAEDGSAANAFDGSASTFWHTQYTGTAPTHPHEIQIDLGATVAIKGMRCLPRQDKDNHGLIADYEFYASEDKTNWGTKVASGTFDSTRNEHIVSFPTMNARYIRLVALSEIEGGAWTSLAELDLVPAP